MRVGMPFRSDTSSFGIVIQSFRLDHSVEQQGNRSGAPVAFPAARTFPFRQSFGTRMVLIIALPLAR